MRYQPKTQGICLPALCPCHHKPFQYPLHGLARSSHRYAVSRPTAESVLRRLPLFPVGRLSVCLICGSLTTLFLTWSWYLSFFIKRALSIDLDLKTGRTMSILNDFMRLQNMHRAATILKEYKDQLVPFVKLFDWLRKNNTRVKDIRYAMENINNIKA